MAPVWHFGEDGVIQRVESSGRRTELVHLPTGQVVTSYSCLEQILTELGWERYHGGNPDLLQFHKRSSIDLISLPREFARFNYVNMNDIVVKHPPNVFRVREI